MKHTHSPLRALTLGAVLIAAPMSGHAACYAEYKAKRDNPLQLHYGIAKMNDDACSSTSAAAALAPRLSADNWVLLSIIGFVDETQLNEVKAHAGDYFLRY